MNIFNQKIVMIINQYFLFKIKKILINRFKSQKNSLKKEKFFVIQFFGIKKILMNNKKKKLI